MTTTTGYAPARAAVEKIAETSPEAAHVLTLLDAGGSEDEIRAATDAALDAVVPLDFGPHRAANAAVRVFVEESFRLATTPLPE